MIFANERTFFIRSELQHFAEFCHNGPGMLDQVLKAKGGEYVWLTVSTDQPIEAKPHITRGWYQAAYGGRRS